MLVSLSICPPVYAQDPSFNYELKDINIIPAEVKKGESFKVSAEMLLTVNGTLADRSNTRTTIYWWIDGVYQPSGGTTTNAMRPGYIDGFEKTIALNPHILNLDKGYIDITCAINPGDDQSLEINGQVVAKETTYTDNRKTVRVYLDQPSSTAVYVQTPDLRGHPKAAHENWQETVPTNKPKTGEKAAETKQIQDKYRGQTAFERMIANVIGGLTQTVYEILGIKDPLELIFDYEPMIKFNGEQHHQKRSELYLGLFDKEGKDLIADIYNYLIRYTPILLTMILVATGFYLMIFATTSDTRVDVKDLLQGIIAGLLALAIGPHLMDAIFSIIYAGVEVIKHLIEQKLADRGMTTPTSLIGVMVGGLLMQQGDLATPDDVNAVIGMVSSLGYMLIIFVVFIGAGILNWQYFMRKLTIALGIIVFPVVAMVSVLPTKRRALQIWFTEFISSAALVLIHALIYGFLILMFTAYGRPFNIFETMVYVLGMSSATNYVRRLFGADSGGLLGNATGMAGLGAMIGLLGLRRGGFLSGGAGKTATSSVSTATGIAGTETAVKSTGGFTPQMTNLAGIGGVGVSHKDTKNIIGQGRDITHSQADLMAGQTTSTFSQSTPMPTMEMSDPFYDYDDGDYIPPTPVETPIIEQPRGLTEKQQMELKGPQRDFAISPPETPRTSSWSRVGQIAGVAAGATVGGLLSGAFTGNSTAGFALGGATGGTMASKMSNMGSNIRRTFKEPQSMGIYTAGQFLDPKSATQIGRNIAGTPGAMVGATVGRVISMGRRMSAMSTGESYVNPAEQIRRQIDQQYQTSHIQYQEAQQKVQLAEYNLQQHELMTPVPERDEEYQAKHKELEQARDEEVRKFHIQRLAFKEAEAIKANEHHYVGIELKMQELKRQHHSNGDINGHEWR